MTREHAIENDRQDIRNYEHAATAHARAGGRCWIPMLAATVIVLLYLWLILGQ
jgi:hypothetical protein